MKKKNLWLKTQCSQSVHKAKILYLPVMFITVFITSPCCNHKLKTVKAFCSVISEHF